MRIILKIFQYFVSKRKEKFNYSVACIWVLASSKSCSGDRNFDEDTKNLYEPHTASMTELNQKDAKTAAENVWNLFYGGTHKLRPFGAARLDGIDLMPRTNSALGYSEFLKNLKSIAAENNYKLSVTGIQSKKTISFFFTNTTCVHGEINTHMHMYSYIGNLYLIT